MKIFLAYDDNWEYNQKYNWKHNIVYIVIAKTENEALIHIRKYRPDSNIIKIEEINSKEKSLMEKNDDDKYFEKVDYINYKEKIICKL